MAGIGGAAPAIAAAAVNLRRRRILGKFRALGALSADSARSREDLGTRRSLIFRRMEKLGVLIDRGDEHYYLDENAEERERHRRQRRATWILAAVTVAVVAFLLIERL